MDIRTTLDQLNKLLEQGDFENLLQRCSDLLENPTLAENHRVLLLDQKVKALTALNRLEEATAATLEDLPSCGNHVLYVPDYMSGECFGFGDVGRKQGADWDEAFRQYA